MNTSDIEISNIIKKEYNRQKNGIELISHKFENEKHKNYR